MEEQRGRFEYAAYAYVEEVLLKSVLRHCCCRGIVGRHLDNVLEENLLRIFEENESYVNSFYAKRLLKRIVTREDTMTLLGLDKRGDHVQITLGRYSKCRQGCCRKRGQWQGDDSPSFHPARTRAYAIYYGGSIHYSRNL